MGKNWAVFGDARGFGVENGVNHSCSPPALVLESGDPGRPCGSLYSRAGTENITQKGEFWHSFAISQATWFMVEASNSFGAETQRFTTVKYGSITDG